MTLPPRDALHTTEQAAEALDVPAHVIRQWKYAGKAMPAGMLRAAVPGGLQPLYYLTELEDLAARYHARNARRLGQHHSTDTHRQETSHG